MIENCLGKNLQKTPIKINKGKTISFIYPLSFEMRV
jgi:hypothetical protein